MLHVSGIERVDRGVKPLELVMTGNAVPLGVAVDG
jgi:hypothetical protein